jgi:transposase
MSPSQKRASLILQVRAGQITAQQAARELGISRQAYYQWEKRALSALLQALEDQPKGRPKRESDPEKEQLQSRVEQLQQKVRVFEEREKLRTILKQMEESSGDSSSKKNSK